MGVLWIWKYIDIRIHVHVYMCTCVAPYGGLGTYGSREKANQYGVYVVVRGESLSTLTCLIMFRK
jgi:hypothetical protein